MSNTMTESQIREHMVTLGAALYKSGLSSGSSGNISVRLDENSILATPTNSCMGRLDAASLSVVAMDGTLISGALPSKECAFHLKMYAARPQCGAVVHLHSTYATALSCLTNAQQMLEQPITPYFVMNVAPVVCIDYYKPGSAELFAAIGEKAGQGRSVLLANHGFIATGDCLEKAIHSAEEFEETAKLMLLLKAHKSDIRHLSPSEIQELLPKT